MRNPRLDHVLAGCLISPGLDASQKLVPANPSGPSQSLARLIKKSDIDKIAVSIGMPSTRGFEIGCDLFIAV